MRCKNLETLQLTNCIKELSSNICQLTNLKTLKLNNNNNLVNIPDCIFDLSITLINFSGSENIKLPSNVADKFTQSAANKLIYLTKNLKFI